MLSGHGGSCRSRHHDHPLGFSVGLGGHELLDQLIKHLIADLRLDPAGQAAPGVLNVHRSKIGKRPARPVACSTSSGRPQRAQAAYVGAAALWELDSRTATGYDNPVNPRRTYFRRPVLAGSPTATGPGCSCLTCPRFGSLSKGSVWPVDLLGDPICCPNRTRRRNTGESRSTSGFDAQ
jgi:hypothetical protein